MAKKYALLVGVSEYSDPKFARLNAPAADVAALAAALEEPGIASFDSVVRLVEPNREQVVVGLVDLFADKGRDDLVLLYFSGHGVRNIRDKLFLALGKTRFDWPLGSSIAAAELKHYMDDCDSQRQVLILDCCYAGAFMGPHRGGASAPVLTEGTFEVRGYGREVLTATNESGLAFDGGEVRDDDGTVRQLGKFTRFLVEGLRTGAGIADRDEITVTDLFEHARRGLAAEDPRMRPQHWRERGEAPLVIARNRQARPRLPDELLAALGDKSDPVRRRGAVDWLDDLIRNVDPRLRAAALRELRRCEPGEENRFVHQRMLLVLQRVDTTVPETPAPAAPAVLRPKSELDWPAGRVFRDVDASWCPEMVVVPAGEFMMGSPEGEAGRRPNEGPQCWVTIARPFAVGRYTVMHDEYDAFCEATGRGKPEDQGWGRGRRPAIKVSWEDAQAYVRWLAERTGQPYRLPSEAEWEYAARGGTATPFWTGATISTAQANYDGKLTYGKGKMGEYRERTVPVDEPGFPANPFGLYHVHGNVWELVEDSWHDTYEGAPSDGSAWLEKGGGPGRVLRGGSWFMGPGSLRSAFRLKVSPRGGTSSIGFRVARMLTP